MKLPDFSVKDRRVLITGAGRGIGLAMAKALAAGGATVAVQDIDEDVARKEADAIVTAGGRAFGFGGDLADAELPGRLVEQANAAMGGVDVLINNGSIQTKTPFEEVEADVMRKQLEANWVAPARLCQLVLPAMAERGWGRVINLSSIQAKNGNSHMPAYAASRAAIENLTRGLARKYGKAGVTVNAIAPGWFDTYRNVGDFKDAADKAERGKWLPLGRVGEPDDCDGVCLLLCSDAGKYITGQVISVDGGMSI